MKVAMLLLALYGTPQDADWRVTFTSIVPASQCEAERAKLNQPGSTYRIVCEDPQKLAAGTATLGSQTALQPEN